MMSKRYWRSMFWAKLKTFIKSKYIETNGSSTAFDRS